MAFKTVTDLSADNTISLGGFNKKANKNNPTSAEGYFLGSRQVVSPKSKTGFAAIHVLQTSKGNLGVWGKTDLDRKMQGVTPGTMVRITFTGTVETKNNPMYKFKVEVDEDNTIEVSASTENGGDDAYAGGEETSADAVEAASNDDDYDEDAAQAAALLAAQRQAKLQEILNRGKAKKN